MSGRIDTHQHLVPPRYRAWLDELGLAPGGLQTPPWSEELALSAMDTHEIEVGIVSLPTPPAVRFGDAQNRWLARHINEYAAELAERRADRFGFFATVTLPDVESAIVEAAYALDELHAEGVILMANNDGLYLGDPQFDPLLAELDRRHAVAFIHPSTLPGPPAAGIPPYIADFLLDTTRTAVSLVRAGAITRYPNMTFILSHSGGFIPFAAHRLAITMTFDTDRTVEEYLTDLRSFHVDIAQTASTTSMPAVLDFFGPRNVLFGTDWPHASDPGVAYFTDRFDTLELSNDVRGAIDSSNARALLPRYAGQYN